MSAEAVLVLPAEIMERVRAEATRLSMAPEALAKAFIEIGLDRHVELGRMLREGRDTSPTNLFADLDEPSPRSDHGGTYTSNGLSRL